MVTRRNSSSTSLIEFGRRLRLRRIAQGLSQEDLADAAGLHRTYVGSVERGERNIALINILRLAEALGVDAGELLREMNP
jgi:transcriptional regulator with XRE-family HTH domain